MSTIDDRERPLLALTMGDVAGVGPELIARAWADSTLLTLARPLVVGSPDVMRRALALVGHQARVVSVDGPEAKEAAPDVVPVFEPPGVDVSVVEPGVVDGRAGRAAGEYLIAAADLALARRVDGIVTLPLHKEALHAGGVDFPGHTEILAERCAAVHHAMMLYLPPGEPGGPGFGVLHATLHMALRDVFRHITIESVAANLRLADRSFRPLTGGEKPRVAVAALNPHAGEGGLFGDEEQTILRPAIELARGEGIEATGPIPADTLFVRALAGEFDAVVAMYHDQGHVALKTIGFERAVNVTLGLPIVRTSVAHGTAFDIAWTGRARPSSLLEAVRVAARYVEGRRRMGLPPGTD